MPQPVPVNYIYWLFLAGSILFEVCGTSIMKASQTEWPVTGMLLMYALLAASYYCLAKAVVKIPLGVAYAFWEGFGLLLIALVSVLCLDETINGTQGIALGMILAGTLLVNHGTEEGHGIHSEGEKL